MSGDSFWELAKLISRHEIPYTKHSHPGHGLERLFSTCGVTFQMEGVYLPSRTARRTTYILWSQLHFPGWSWTTSDPAKWAKLSSPWLELSKQPAEVLDQDYYSGTCQLKKQEYLYSQRGMKTFPGIIESRILFASHLSFFLEILGAVSDEKGECVHHDTAKMEQQYQGRWDMVMMERLLLVAL